MKGDRPRTAFLSLVLTVGAFPLSAQPSAGSSWLDRGLFNWNRPGADLPHPQHPEPVTGRCREQVRQPAGAVEKTVADAGWLLYGPVQSNAATRVVLGMAASDGMCRPMHYQAFVFSGD